MLRTIRRKQQNEKNFKIITFNVRIRLSADKVIELENALNTTDIFRMAHLLREAKKIISRNIVFHTEMGGRDNRLDEVGLTIQHHLK